MNLLSFVAGKWKWETLNTITKRPYLFSTHEILQKELNYIGNVFRANNRWPIWVIKKVLQQAKQKQQQQQTTTTIGTTTGRAGTPPSTNNNRCSRKTFFITPL